MVIAIWIQQNPHDFHQLSEMLLMQICHNKTDLDEHAYHRGIRRNLGRMRGT